VYTSCYTKNAVGGPIAVSLGQTNEHLAEGVNFMKLITMKQIYLLSVILLGLSLAGCGVEPSSEVTQGIIGNYFYVHGDCSESNTDLLQRDVFVRRLGFSISSDSLKWAPPSLLATNDLVGADITELDPEAIKFRFRSTTSTFAAGGPDSPEYYFSYSYQQGILKVTDHIYGDNECYVYKKIN
jgi:hypothetical protein